MVSICSSLVITFAKQFGLKSGPTKRRAWLGSNLFDTQMAFLKDFSFRIRWFSWKKIADDKKAWTISQGAMTFSVTESWKSPVIWTVCQHHHIHFHAIFVLLFFFCFFFSKLKLKKKPDNISPSSLDSNHARHFFRADLCPKSLQILSAELMKKYT